MSSGERKLVRIGNYIMTGKVLGKGHFARVEEAVHSILNVKVAVKIINFKDITDIYVQNNLRREAKIMSNIAHPNVIFLFETLETSKNYYLVTEIGTGGDLCNHVKSQRFGKLDERRARPLARQLVSAVGHLHQRGIVHRDLKMENILLDHTKEKIKLVDFGLSNFCKSNELLKTHCGSPEYAAPELYISGRRYGPEVDIWSLCVDNVYGVCLRGIILYGMMVGKLPFQTWYKTGLTHEERRKHLMQETKRGLTFKHQRILMDFSYLFRNLIMKMLNPIAKDRILMHELQIHPWIYGNYIREFPEVEREWHKRTIMKIASGIKISCTDTASQINANPFGPVGGFYNIEKLSYLNNKLSASYLKSDFRDLKSPSYATITSRPMTSRYATMQTPRINTCKPRPRTSETNNSPGDLKATSNFPAKAEHDINVKACFSEPKANQKSRSTTTKMFNFLNEKISQAFNIYNKKNEKKAIFKDIVDKMDILPEKERPRSVPAASDCLHKNGNTRYFTHAHSINTQIKAVQNDVSSGNSTARHTARTRFIKYLCSSDNHENFKNERPRTTPNKMKYTLGAEDTSYYKTYTNISTPSCSKICKKPDCISNPCCISKVQSREKTDFRRKNQLPENSIFLGVAKKKPGVPNHTAARASVRREMAIRSSSNQFQSRFVP